MAAAREEAQHLPASTTEHIHEFLQELMENIAGVSGYGGVPIANVHDLPAAGRGNCKQRTVSFTLPISGASHVILDVIIYYGYSPQQILNKVSRTITKRYLSMISSSDQAYV